jgi:hypothetical protein
VLLSLLLFVGGHEAHHRHKLFKTQSSTFVDIDSPDEAIDLFARRLHL